MNIHNNSITEAQPATGMSPIERALRDLEGDICNLLAMAEITATLSEQAFIGCENRPRKMKEEARLSFAIYDIETRAKALGEAFEAACRAGKEVA